MVEWLKKIFKKKKKTEINPSDNYHYFIATKVIRFTETILKEYGAGGVEGVVYWAGYKKGNNFYVTSAIAPQSHTSRYGIFTNHETNANFVDFLCDHNLIYICQVHSHPSTYVTHSVIDNEETAFRSEGLVSLVVPSYSFYGMLPLSKCGIHRYTNNQFYKLNNKYIMKHFHVVTQNKDSSILKDFRHGK